jgi:hypothetical protein
MRVLAIMYAKEQYRDTVEAVVMVTMLYHSLERTETQSMA